MAQKNINIGSSANKGDGDPLRTAFGKAEDNFTELYSRLIVVEQQAGISNPGGATITQSIIGSVLGEDSTVLVDGSGSTIDASNLTGALPAIDGSALIGVTASSVAFADVTGTPTTLAGYGITDAFDGAFGSLTGTPTTLAGYGITDAFDGAFGSLTGTPTTIADYGITDAQAALVSGTNIKTINGQSLLGSGNITISDGSGGSAFTNIGVGADDSTIRSISEGESFLILGGTGITTASDAEGNITITASVQSINDLSDVDTTTIAPSRSMQPLIWDDIDQNWYPGNGISITANLTMEDNSFIMLRENAYLNFEGSITDGFDTKFLVVNPTANRTIRLPDADGTVALASTTLAGYGITDAYTKAEVDSSIADVTAGHFDFNITGDDSTVRTVSSGSTIGIVGGTGITTASDADGNITITASGGGGSGLQSRSTATATTGSIPDGSQVDLDITGFKSYALLSITTDRAARVRLYVSSATRSADASRAEGVDPTSDAGLIAEVITTGAETVIISPGAFGFNLEGTPTSIIPCRVTNKSGGASTVQVDLNILQLEA